MSEKNIWKQERPEFCNHADCYFKFRVTNSMCGGELLSPEPHDGDFNTHRFCLNGAADDGGVFDLQINKTDVWWFRKMFDEMFQTEMEYIRQQRQAIEERSRIRNTSLGYHAQAHAFGVAHCEDPDCPFNTG